MSPLAEVNSAERSRKHCGPATISCNAWAPGVGFLVTHWTSRSCWLEAQDQTHSETIQKDSQTLRAITCAFTPLGLTGLSQQPWGWTPMSPMSRRRRRAHLTPHRDPILPPAFAGVTCGTGTAHVPRGRMCRLGGRDLGGRSEWRMERLQAPCVSTVVLPPVGTVTQRAAFGPLPELRWEHWRLKTSTARGSMNFF